MKNAELNIVLFDDSDVIATSSVAGWYCTAHTGNSACLHLVVNSFSGSNASLTRYVSDPSGYLTESGTQATTKAVLIRAKGSMPAVNDWYSFSNGTYTYDSSVSLHQ